MRTLSRIFIVLCVWLATAKADDLPRTPCIDSVVMSRPQPQESDAAVIWYDDFGNLHWFGNKPVSAFKLHSTEEAGRWVCVESRAKLNAPGKHDGLNQLWIDGRLEAERKSLDWRGSYARYGINAVFLETYWNKGLAAGLVGSTIS